MNDIQIFYMHNDKKIREKNILTREVMDQCANGVELSILGFSF
jgi:hypothetical protein